ncbi:MAG: TonB-dependent receptor [Bacteroidales bacterium]|jgi:TonB-linked SusC/RagA family outer membrane protein|nr:TonB-dependent receptor [Bacteroidales bacterium]
MKTKKLGGFCRMLLSLLLLALPVWASAQQVSGIVQDVNGEPMIGVSVAVYGTDQGTITDLDGHFSVNAKSTDQLTFSYVGYKTQYVKVMNRTAINVTLQEDNELLEEVVVVGYDTQKKANLTGAVATVSVDDQLDGRPIPNVGTGLQGATPGLTVTNTSGRLGSSPTFRIRGQVSSLINESGCEPLILVDGVEISDISMINADDIADISVLKDAASSSIYGTRGAFGVILITTKSGAKAAGNFQINYSNNFNWATPTVLPEVAKSYVGAEMALEARQRRSPGTTIFKNACGLVWDANSIDRMKEWDRMFSGQDLSDEMVLGRDFEIISGDTYFYRSWDAAKMYMKDFAFSQQHNLSVSGQQGKTNYYIGLGYMGQGGVIKVNPDEYKRFSVNANIESEVTKWFKVRSKMLYTRTNLSEPFNFGSANYDALYYLYRWPSIMPYGTYEGHPFRNSITETAAASMNSNEKDYMRATVGGTFTIIPDLTFDVDYTFNLDNQDIIQRGGKVGGWDFWNGGLNLVSNWAATSRDKIDTYYYKRQYHVGNAVLKYKHTWNEAHRFQAFAGFNIEYKDIRYLNAEKRNLLDQNKPEISLATGDDFVYGSHSAWSTMGFFARVNYSYKDRYLIELNGRYDGSSRFPTNKLWGFFPSGSLGWVASEESWWEVMQPWWSFAKLRASYGSIGNQNVGSNMFRAIISSSNSGWIVNDVDEITFSLPRAIAEGFTWETIKTMDFGADFRFFNDDLGASFDIYRRINDGMIVGGAEVPSTYGASAPYQNAAQLTTNGWELTLDYHHRFTNGLQITASAGVADAVGIVTKHPRKETSVLDGSNYEGKIVGEIWGFTTDRLFQENDFDANGNLNPGIPSQAYFEGTNGYGYKYGPGDVKYVDLNGDGEITWGNKTVADHGDWSRIGNSTPRFEYNFRVGLEWKGIDFALFCQGVGKRDYWATGTMMIPGWNFSEGTYYAHQTDYWTPENTQAWYPRLTEMNQPGQYSAASFNFLCQTRYMLDLSYLRLKNITIGYSLPKKALKAMRFQKFRIYGSFENVAELTHLGKLPIDPETQTSAGDGGAMGYGRIYPFTRQLSFGLQITL